MIEFKNLEGTLYTLNSIDCIEYLNKEVDGKGLAATDDGGVGIKYFYGVIFRDGCYCAVNEQTYGDLKCAMSNRDCVAAYKGFEKK